MAEIKNIKDQVYHTLINPLFNLPLGDEYPKEVNMLVETPMGSINKYEYHSQTGLLKLDRVLFSKIPYPVEYGAIPMTWDEDNDPLDMMCIVHYPTFPGCLISVRPIGVMKFNDSGEIDDKILGVPVDDIRYKHIKELEDLTEHQKEEIAFFFQRYKEVQFKMKKQHDKKVEILGWGDRHEAIRLIDAAHELFKQKFAGQLQ